MKYNLADLSLHILITTWSIHGLKRSTKQQRLTEWIKKYEPIICHLKHFNNTDKFKRDGKDISRKVNQKKVEMATLTSARVDLEWICRSIKGHCHNNVVTQSMNMTCLSIYLIFNFYQQCFGVHRMQVLHLLCQNCSYVFY